MKKKFSKVLGVALALVLALSLGGLVAAPAPAVEASSSVSNVWVQIDSYTAGATSIKYRVYFTPGADLTAGVDTVTVVFPTGTDASGVATSDVLVDPDADVVTEDALVADTVVSSTLVVVVTPDEDLTAGTEARLDIDDVDSPTPDPAIPTAYTLEVYTSQETTHVTSSAYTIGVTEVTGVSFAPFTTGTADEAGVSDNFTVTFTTTSAGALTTGVDTITITFPPGTSVPAMITAANVIVDPDGGGAALYKAASSVITSPTARSVIIYGADDIAASTTVFVTFSSVAAVNAGIKNGSIATVDPTGGSISGMTAYIGMVNTSRDLGLELDTGGPATPGYDIQPGEANQVAFWALSAVLVGQGEKSGTIKVQLKDKYGNLAYNTNEDCDVDLTTSSATGQFYYATAYHVPPLTITLTSSTDYEKSFQYYDTTAGTATITATHTATGASVWTSAPTWDITVEAEHVVSLYHAGVLVDTYTTITTALANALAEDVIKVSPGTYTEATLSITVDSLTLEATGTAAETIIDPETTTDAIEVDNDSVTIKNFTVKNSSTTAGTNILIEVDSATAGNASILTIDGCVFDLTAGKAATKGIVFTANNGAIASTTVKNCTFNVLAATTAIVSTAGNNNTTFTVEDCAFTGSSGIGLDIDGNGSIADVTVQSNTFDSLEKAINIAETTGTTNVDVKWNTIKNSTAATTAVGAIDIADASDVDIVGNTFEDNLGYAVNVAANASNVEVIFNNIAGNTYGVKSAVATLEAAHNWWGAATGPGGVATGGGDPITAYVGYDPWLGGTIQLGKAQFTTGVTSLDALATAGVKVIGVTTTGTSRVGAALYTANPQLAPVAFTALTDGFFDVYVDSSAAITGETGIKLYVDGVTSGDKAYMWDEFQGAWLECSEQAYSAAGYVWVRARAYTATYPDLVPCIEDLKYTPFAVGTPVVARTLQSIAVTPATASIIVGGTKQFTATGTYDVAPLTEDITTTVTWASSATSVATIAATGLATGVAEGTTNITATLDTIVSTAAVLTVTPDDILAYYRGLGDDPNVVETSDLLQAADDWLADVVPPGFTVAITTAQLLELADEWIAAG